MPRQNGRTGERWFTCDRSGFEFPYSRMRRQDGFRIADIFFDEPGGQTQTADPRGQLDLSGETMDFEETHAKR